MLLRHTLLYLPAQFIGPLFQLVAMMVWTHLVNEPTLGVLTLVTATHELLQIGFLAWWSQYALRFFGRYQDGDAPRFYRTENTVLLLSVMLQSIAMAGILLLVIAPGAKAGILLASVGYVITRSLNVYIGERARVRHQIGVYSIQQIFGPAIGFILGLVLIKLFGHPPNGRWRAMPSRNCSQRSSFCRRSATAAASGRSTARSSATPCVTAFP